MSSQEDKGQRGEWEVSDCGIRDQSDDVTSHGMPTARLVVRRNRNEHFRKHDLVTTSKSIFFFLEGGKSFLRPRNLTGLTKLLLELLKR